MNGFADGISPSRDRSLQSKKHSYKWPARTPRFLPSTAAKERARKQAMAIYAMNEAVAFQPQSSWVRSRRGFTSQMPSPGGDNPTGGDLIP